MKKCIKLNIILVLLTALSACNKDISIPLLAQHEKEVQADPMEQKQRARFGTWEVRDIEAELSQSLDAQHGF